MTAPPSDYTPSMTGRESFRELLFDQVKQHRDDLDSHVLSLQGHGLIVKLCMGHVLKVATEHSELKRRLEEAEKRIEDQNQQISGLRVQLPMIRDEIDELKNRQTNTHLVTTENAVALGKLRVAWKEKFGEGKT